MDRLAMKLAYASVVWVVITLAVVTVQALQVAHG